MKEQTARTIEHAYFSKAVKTPDSQKELGQHLVFMLNIDKAQITQTQLEALLDILDHAVSEADTVISQ